MRLLLVEDDEMLGASLRRALEKHGYGVDWVQDGDAALRTAETSPFLACVLDINLPGISGLDVLRTLRKKHNPLPVLVVTARDSSQQKIEGLDSGADDYIVKPFDLPELLARLRALVRRSQGRVDPVLRSGPVELDLDATVVRKDGAPVMMTAKEIRLLRLLMERAGKFVTKSDIEYTLYSTDDTVESNAVEVTIYNLRKKLGSDFIQTIRGVGYMVAA